MKKIILSILFFMLIVLPGRLQAHDVSSSQQITIDEKNGQTIPVDLIFYDEQGNETALKDLTDTPVILSLVYYTCDRICPQMLLGIAQVLPRINLTPQRDYRVVTISFDEQDTPQAARELKKNFIKALGSSYPGEGWRFLTGKKTQIEALTNSVGFTFRRDNHGFIHPIALIILSPGGRISRYIHVPKFAYGVEYPVNFSPVELEIALTDAGSGRVANTVRRAFLYCFPHEPGRQKSFFLILSLAGIATLVGLAAFFIILKRSSPKGRTGNRDGSAE